MQHNSLYSYFLLYIKYCVYTICFILKSTPCYIINMDTYSIDIMLIMQCVYLHICLWPMTTTSHKPAASAPPSLVKLRYRPTAVHVSLTVAPAATGPLCRAHSVCVDLSGLLPTFSVNLSRRSGSAISSR